MSEQNVHELAQYLKVSEISFAIRYLQEFYDSNLDAYVFAFKTNNPNDPTNGCIFHLGINCSIYGSCRTDLCQVFPWNYFDIEQGAWKPEFVATDGTCWCRGIGKGKEWSLEEIGQLKEKFTGIGFGFKRQLNNAQE
jgi:hypothetical protein